LSGTRVASDYSEGPCGTLAGPDFDKVHNRVKTFDDMARDCGAAGVARLCDQHRRMDSAKELLVSLYGDALLERGLAVLAWNGPGHVDLKALAQATLGSLWRGRTTDLRDFPFIN
jgi:hypothetical protein